MAARDAKRDRILKAARAIYETEGLEGASLRAIAKAAGYTPAALYFHFENKQAIYAGLLDASLRRLCAAMEAAERAALAETPADRLRAAARALYLYYCDYPKDLDLSFALFRDGLSPTGFGSDAERRHNARMSAALAPIENALWKLGAAPLAARAATAEVCAQIVGLLTLQQSRRLGAFSVRPRDLLERHVDRIIDALTAHDAAPYQLGPSQMVSRADSGEARHS